jgi:hypothetical protein
MKCPKCGGKLKLLNKHTGYVMCLTWYCKHTFINPKLIQD